MSLSRPDLERLAEELAAAHTRWERLVSHSAGPRSYARVWESDEVNAWLICWGERHDTGWHDHDDSAAAIAVLDGQVREERLRLARRPATRILSAGRTFYVPPSAIHRVMHAGSRPAVTLHAYSPPLRRTGGYWIAPDGELQRVSQPSEEELRADAALA